MVSQTGSLHITPTPLWAGETQPHKSGWRPPDYNAEDYISGLVLRRPGGSCSPPPPPHQQQSVLRDEEMSLKQFSSVSELLAKLAQDLRQAYPSFVEEFVSRGLDGCDGLLETLRAVQVSGQQVQPGGAGVRRQSSLDELACLQCLSACFRCPQAPHRLASASSGLFPLAAAIMSNLNKSRILALQILTKVCEEGEGKGFGPVSDAMSTMRLRFGEPVRFKFLCGMLSSAGPELLHAGLAFLNAFLEAAGDPQARLYLQAELAQAGFSLQHITKTLSTKVPCVDLIRGELNRWQRLQVDVKELKSREGELVKEVYQLKDKLKSLERKLQVLEDEKCLMSRSESRLKARCSELEREVSSLRRDSAAPPRPPASSAPSPAEDEGISSSGQDDPPETSPLIYRMYSDNSSPKLKEEEETTIDEVIEELENIINDAETDIQEKRSSQKQEDKEVVGKYYTKFMQRSSHEISTSHIERSHESEIVPVQLPHPPRRSRSLYFEKEYTNHLFFDEGESDSSDSLLSASNEQMQYFNKANNTKNNPHSKAHLELLQQEVQKSYVRRRETFHHPAQTEVPTIEIKPETNKYRRGSLNEIFPYNEIPTKGTKIYIEGTDRNEKRLMSKSLDRIRDGLDTMVDIVMTNEIESPPIIRPIPMQRTATNSKRSVYSVCSSKKCAGAEESGRYSTDRTVFLPIRDEPADTSQQTFFLQRGPCLNAGLYSGHLNQPSPIPATINISDYYNKSLNGLNLSVTGKLTDLPSGLY